MADAEHRPIGSVPFRVTDPERIPSKRYYDEEFYKLECEKLWPHTWQMACRLEQIPNVGDWYEYSNVGKSVFVVRTKDGVKAFHNACRHRGVQLLSGHGNCKTQGVICPFHGWRWNAEGKNTFVYGRHMFGDTVLDPADLDLIPVQTEEWNGCAFINFDNDAPSLRETMGELLYEGMNVRNADSMRAEWWYSTVLPANWKVAMEAFMEGFHVLRTHPQLHNAAGFIYNMLYGPDTGGLGNPVNMNITTKENIAAQVKHFHLLSEGMAGMCHAKDVAVAETMLDLDLPEDQSEGVMMWYGMLGHQISEQAKARGEATPDLNAVAMSHPVQAVEYMFPHYFVLPFLSSMAAYRIRPLGPETCIFELWSLTHFPEGQEPEPVMEPRILPYDSQEFPPIPRQDYENIPRQQIGLRAEGFEFMRLGKDIEGMISNYQRLIDGYLEGKPLDKLARSTNKLAHNFDGKIKDMELS